MNSSPSPFMRSAVITKRTTSMPARALPLSLRVKSTIRRYRLSKKRTTGVSFSESFLMYRRKAVRKVKVRTTEALMA